MKANICDKQLDNSIFIFSAKKVNEMEIKPKSGRCYNREHVENNTNVK